MPHKKNNPTNDLSLNKKTGITFLILFFISRVTFLNGGNIFFDSGEYHDLFANPNFFQALISGHFPTHEGYILVFWPAFQIAKLLQLNPYYTVVFAQALLATFTISCFYKIIS